MRRAGWSAVALLAGLAVTLAGCGGRQIYERPRSDVPESFRGGAEAGPAASKSFGELGWWEVYQDPQLVGLIARALDRNHDVKIAAARIAEARANYGVADYGPLPQVSAGAAFSRSRVSPVGSTPLPANVGTQRKNFRATLDVNYEVDFWGRLASLSDAARADLMGAESARDVVTATLVGDLATAWFDLLSLDQQRVLTERSIESRQKFLDLTETRLKLGAAIRVEVDRARANLAAVRATLPDLQRRIEQGENLLRFLAGEFPATVQRQLPNVDALPNPPEVPVGLPSTLLERRPDIRVAEYTLVANNARLASQRAALLPTFSLTGQYGSEAGLLENFLTSPSAIWSLGANLLQPIINAQRNRFLVDAAAAREVQSIENYQKVVESSVREVSDALIGRREFAEVRKAQVEQVVALREVNRLALRRYEAGVASYFEVVDAQRELLAAELALAQAQRNLLISSVQLYKALGGGWQSKP